MKSDSLGLRSRHQDIGLNAPGLFACLFLYFIYLFGFLRSSLHHARSFVAVHRLSSCGEWA